MRNKTQFPPGWDEARVRDVVDFYERQSDDEAAAEHELALGRPDHTLMPIPHELVPEVQQLLSRHAEKRAS